MTYPCCVHCIYCRTSHTEPCQYDGCAGKVPCQQPVIDRVLVALRDREAAT